MVKMAYRFIHTARPPSRGPYQLIERVSNADLVTILMVSQHSFIANISKGLLKFGGGNDGQHENHAAAHCICIDCLS